MYSYTQAFYGGFVVSVQRGTSLSWQLDARTLWQSSAIVGLFCLSHARRTNLITLMHLSIDGHLQLRQAFTATVRQHVLYLHEQCVYCLSHYIMYSMYRMYIICTASTLCIACLVEQYWTHCVCSMYCRVLYVHNFMY